MPAVTAQLNHYVIESDRSATPKSAPVASGQAGFLRRALKAIQEARLKQAEREVARFIEIRGGRITDNLEREIEHHFV